MRTEREEGGRVMFALLEEETNCSCKRLPLFAAPATGSGAATGCRRVRPRL